MEQTTRGTKAKKAIQKYETQNIKSRTQQIKKPHSPEHVYDRVYFCKFLKNTLVTQKKIYSDSWMGEEVPMDAKDIACAVSWIISAWARFKGSPVGPRFYDDV